MANYIPDSWKDMEMNPGFQGGEELTPEELQHKRMYGGFTGPGAGTFGDSHGVSEIEMKDSDSYKATGRDY